MAWAAKVVSLGAVLGGCLLFRVSACAGPVKHCCFFLCPSPLARTPASCMPPAPEVPSAGIVTSTMTGLLGQSRLLVVLGRERLLPLALAEVSERFGTPVRATVVTGAAAATLAFVLDIGILAELVSIGGRSQGAARDAGVQAPPGAPCCMLPRLRQGMLPACPTCGASEVPH